MNPRRHERIPLPQTLSNLTREREPFAEVPLCRDGVSHHLALDPPELNEPEDQLTKRPRPTTASDIRTRRSGRIGRNTTLRAVELVAGVCQERAVVRPRQRPCSIERLARLVPARDAREQPAIEPVLARLPVQTRRGYLLSGLPLEGNEARYAQSFEKMLALVMTLYEEKVPLVAGTDGLAGFGLHRELALYVRAGIPTAAVLRMAIPSPASRT